MMRLKRALHGLLAASLLLGSLTSLAAARELPLQVIASFSLLQDMAQQIGGERVQVTALVGPGEDAHVYQPRPSDSRKLAAADLVIENGLGFNGWMERLLTASGYQGHRIIVTKGVERLSLQESPEPDTDHHNHHDHHDHHDHSNDHGAYDPHAWQSLDAAQIYAENILQGLIFLDQEGEAYYHQRAAAYLQQLEQLHKHFKTRFDALPDDRRTVMVPHAAFGYLGAAYGLKFVAPQGVSTASEPSAAEMAELVRQIRDQQVAAVFMENIGDTRLVEQLQRETGATLGGVLYSDALSEGEPAATYLQMMQHNLSSLLAALEPETD